MSIRRDIYSGNEKQSHLQQYQRVHEMHFPVPHTGHSSTDEEQTVNKGNYGMWHVSEKTNDEHNLLWIRFRKRTTIKIISSKQDLQLIAQKMFHVWLLIKYTCAEVVLPSCLCSQSCLPRITALSSRLLLMPESPAVPPAPYKNKNDYEGTWSVLQTN